MVLSLGRAALDPGVVGGGSADVEGARSALFGKLGAGPSSEVDGILPVLLRVFFVGNAGRADVGGPYDGLEGRGIEADMTPIV